MLKDDYFFLLYNSNREFRKISYDYYAKLIKKLPFLKNDAEMLFGFIKDHHRVLSQSETESGFPLIVDFINDWIDETWKKYRVNLAAFAKHYIIYYFGNKDIWPSSHKLKSQSDWLDYEYDYKQKSNLFNLNLLYRKMPKKPYTKARKQEFEVVFMYYWLNEIVGDDDYWQKYLEKVSQVVL